MAGPVHDGHRGFTNGSLFQPNRNGSTGPVGGREGRINGLAKDRGRTNGMVNGLGRTNGLTDGRGRTNGITNRHGYTNGFRLRQNRLGIVPASDVRRGGALIAASAIVVLVLAVFLGTPAVPASPFSADGNFSEWATVPMYSDPVDNVPAQSDLLAYAVHLEPGFLYLYGTMRGPLFSSSATSYVYVALDDPASTGYALRGMEADYLLEMWGWNGTLQGTSLREWTGGAQDRDNASALRAIGSFAAASVGPEFELGVSDVDLRFALSRNPRLMILSEANERTDSGAIVSGNPGALILEQRSLATVVSSAGAVLELHLRALAAAVEVTNLTVDHSGGGTVSLPPLPLYVPMGQERVDWIRFDPSGLPSSTFVTVRVTTVAAVVAGGSTSVPATLSGDGARLYVTSEPSGHRVDGVFAD